MTIEQQEVTFKDIFIDVYWEQKINSWNSVWLIFWVIYTTLLFFWKIAFKEMLTEEMGFEAAANRLELLCVSHAPK